MAATLSLNEINRHISNRLDANAVAGKSVAGIIGDSPSRYSKSPALWNAAFRHLGMNATYLPFDVGDAQVGDLLGLLRDSEQFIGVNVTVPHKVRVMDFLDELDPGAARIQAVNTVVRSADGKLTGYNTDATGALRALGEGGVDLKRRRIVVLGSGGAARAIAFALAAESGAEQLTLLGIEDSERTTLAQDIRSVAEVTIEDSYLDESALRRVLPDAHVLIHCTPVGMAPKSDMTCVPVSFLHEGLAVMDIVYNPRETQLLKDAKQVGCKTIPGLEMFLHQAVTQFELWTNQPAPVAVMRTVLESHFQ